MIEQHRKFILNARFGPNKKHGFSDMKCLNIGCGSDYREGWVNLDGHKTKDVKPDMVHNLNKLPLPFKKEEFDYIFTAHTLEHLQPNQTKLMLEFWRILKPGGILEIRVPHTSWIGAIDGMEHLTPFNFASFAFLTDPTYTKHIPSIPQSDKPLFRDIRHRLMYQRTDDGNRWLISNKGIYYYVAKIISNLANRSPKFCERVWCNWVGGFQEMQIVLKKMSRN